MELAGVRAAKRFDASLVSYDLTDLQPSLGQAGYLDDFAQVPRLIVDSLVHADALIVGSPVYMGSYTCLFKHQFDLIDPAALIGKPILLTATGGGDKHAPVIEHQLRPLFSLFEAASLPTGPYAGAADFQDGVPTSPAHLARLERALSQFCPGCPGGNNARLPRSGVTPAPNPTSSGASRAGGRPFTSGAFPHVP